MEDCTGNFGGFRNRRAIVEFQLLVRLTIVVVVATVRLLLLLLFRLRLILFLIFHHLFLHSMLVDVVQIINFQYLFLIGQELIVELFLAVLFVVVKIIDILENFVLFAYLIFVHRLATAIVVVAQCGQCKFEQIVFLDTFGFAFITWRLQVIHHRIVLLLNEIIDPLNQSIIVLVFRNFEIRHIHQGPVRLLLVVLLHIFVRFAFGIRVG